MSTLLVNKSNTWQILSKEFEMTLHLIGMPLDLPWWKPFAVLGSPEIELEI